MLAAVARGSPAVAPRYDARPMLDRVRAMPGGIRLFLVYAFLILAGIGAQPALRGRPGDRGAGQLRTGVVVMVLLAYTIFTTTLVLQRKQAARGLALGLASLTIPLVPLLALSQLARRGRLRRGPRPAPVPRPAPARGPHLPERAVSASRHRRDGTLTVRGPDAARPTPTHRP